MSSETIAPASSQVADLYPCLPPTKALALAMLRVHPRSSDVLVKKLVV